MSFTGQKSQVNQQQHLNSTYFIDYPTPLQIPENIKTKMSTFHYTRNRLSKNIELTKNYVTKNKSEAPPSERNAQGLLCLLCVYIGPNVFLYFPLFFFSVHNKSVEFALL